MTRRPPEHQNRTPPPDAAEDGAFPEIDAAEIVPAPYLFDIRPLPDEILALMKRPIEDPAEMQRFERLVDHVADRIIRARQEHERRIGKTIRNDPTWIP